MKTDRVVVITGAAGGIGAELVARFLANGDTVVAVDLMPDSLVALAERSDDASPLLTIAADVADEQACIDIAGAIAGTHGRADVLINCAGYFPTQPVATMTLAEWRRVIDINLTGTFLMVRSLLALMNRGWGRIINIGSATIFSGPAGRAHYVASKAGVVGFSHCLASEVGDAGITVNVVHPGLTVTAAVIRDTPAELIDMVSRTRPIKRHQAAADLVGAVFFLASPEADFITGQSLNVDGGLVKR